jgi:hypothetical protein
MQEKEKFGYPEDKLLNHSAMTNEELHEEHVDVDFVNPKDAFLS